MLAALSLLAASAFAQEKTEGPTTFTVHSTDPVVRHGPIGAWDGRFTDPGAVLFHHEQFHMFRNGFQSWPAPVQVGYLTSPDGLTWTPVTTDPVFKTEQVAYAGIAALASSVLVQDDGAWVMYFYTWQTKNGPNAGGTIGRATAPKPTGPWTPDARPVLEPGPKGAWDEVYVSAPSVVRTDEGYVMYYSGQNQARVALIGRATSQDGITWTKYRDAAATDAAFVESSPVLAGSKQAGDWDEQGVYQPNVQRTPDGWVMLYKGIGDIPNSLPHGYATSVDGLTWKRADNNPVLTVKAIPGGRGLWFTNLVHRDDTYFLYFEVGKGASTDIYVATHQGGLK
jgi:hypothetical protein